MAGKTEYKNAWQRENVDRVNLTMPKGKKHWWSPAPEKHEAALSRDMHGGVWLESDLSYCSKKRGHRHDPAWFYGADDRHGADERLYGIFEGRRVVC